LSALLWTIASLSVFTIVLMLVLLPAFAMFIVAFFVPSSVSTTVLMFTLSVSAILAVCPIVLLVLPTTFSLLVLLLLLTWRIPPRLLHLSLFSWSRRHRWGLAFRRSRRWRGLWSGLRDQLLVQEIRQVIQLIIVSVSLSHRLLNWMRRRLLQRISIQISEEIERINIVRWNRANRCRISNSGSLRWTFMRILQFLKKRAERIHLLSRRLRRLWRDWLVGNDSALVGRREQFVTLS
jgi:hypothetical protein